MSLVPRPRRHRMSSVRLAAGCVGAGGVASAVATAPTPHRPGRVDAAAVTAAASLALFVPVARPARQEAMSLALSSSNWASLMVPASLRAWSFASSSALDTLATALFAASAWAAIWTSWAVTFGRAMM